MAPFLLRNVLLRISIIMRSKTLRKTSEFWDLTNCVPRDIIPTMIHSDTQTNQDETNGGNKKVVNIQRTFRLPAPLWQQAITKANGLVSLSAVIRRLLEMWVNDEIDVSKKSK